MGRLVDSAVIWMACTALVAVVGLEPFSVAGMLAAVVAICLACTLASAAARTVVLAAFLAACVAWEPVGAFLPVAACLCAFERSPVLKAGWVIAWAAMALVAAAGMGGVGAGAHAGAAGGSAAMHAGAILVLCCAAALLAWKTERGERTWQALFDARGAEGARTLALLRTAQAKARSSAPGSAASAPAGSSHPADQADLAPDPLDGLTQRERQVAALVAQGKDNQAIAEELFLSEGTVRNYISAILSKKQLKNRTQLAVLCLDAGTAR